MLKKYEIFKPLILKLVSVIDICNRDSHNEYFHTFNYSCKCYIVKPTNIGNNEVINLTISDKKNMGLYELNKKLEIA